ncbi:MAG: chorismate-binding protein [Actinomycetota bacterium]|nr:chorismate-binding protein [Actinomycetota bacterium]
MTLPTNREIPPRERATARFAGVLAREVVESIDLRAEPERLARGGWWAVVGDFSGHVRAWRFAHVERSSDARGRADGRARTDGTAGADGGAKPGGAATPAGGPRDWRGPRPDEWRSSMSRAQYEAAVGATRDLIREGEVYQANICRVLRAPLPVSDDGTEPDALALADRLALANPAPFAGALHVPHGGGVPAAWVVSASPELFLRLEAGRLTSSPIKGTAVHESGLGDKDRAENVMITDLVRNDLQRVCIPGSVDVTALLVVERHPGLVHLVSTVAGELRPEIAGARDAWAQILDGTYPPGSVSGAPKSSALRTIAALEPVDRGPYCGAFGWIDADAGRAELAVAIRTFWWDAAKGGTLRFGTGAGITWGSHPTAEWEETELKARRLVQIASSGPDWSP